MVTHPKFSDVIDKVRKEEVTKDLSKSALETLSIVLYKKNVTRPDIDFIRGVNSSVILRNLMMRGLIEKGGVSSQGSNIYLPSHKLLRHLGVSSQSLLPDFEKTSKILEEKINQFKNSNNQTID
jgi:segregation and condensation protein B